jgi:hypothetical protein
VLDRRERGANWRRLKSIGSITLKQRPETYPSGLPLLEAVELEGLHM